MILLKPVHAGGAVQVNTPNGPIEDAERNAQQRSHFGSRQAFYVPQRIASGYVHSQNGDVLLQNMVRDGSAHSHQLMLPCLPGARIQRVELRVRSIP